MRREAEEIGGQRREQPPESLGRGRPRLLGPAAELGGQGPETERDLAARRREDRQRRANPFEGTVQRRAGGALEGRGQGREGHRPSAGADVEEAPQVAVDRDADRREPNLLPGRVRQSRRGRLAQLRPRIEDGVHQRGSSLVGPALGELSERQGRRPRHEEDATAEAADEGRHLLGRADLPEGPGGRRLHRGAPFGPQRPGERVEGARVFRQAEAQRGVRADRRVTAGEQRAQRLDGAGPTDLRQRPRGDRSQPPFRAPRDGREPLRQRGLTEPSHAFEGPDPQLDRSVALGHGEQRPGRVRVAEVTEDVDGDPSLGRIRVGERLEQRLERSMAQPVEVLPRLGVAAGRPLDPAGGERIVELDDELAEDRPARVRERQRKQVRLERLQAARAQVDLERRATGARDQVVVRSQREHPSVEAVRLVVLAAREVELGQIEVGGEEPLVELESLLVRPDGALEVLPRTEQVTEPAVPLRVVRRARDGFRRIADRVLVAVERVSVLGHPLQVARRSPRVGVGQLPERPDGRFQVAPRGLYSLEGQQALHVAGLEGDDPLEHLLGATGIARLPP